MSTLVFVILASVAFAADIQGSGSPADPYKWENGNLGVTKSCEPYFYDGGWKKLEYRFGRAHYQDLGGGQWKERVVGNGDRNNPFKIHAGVKGLICDPGSGIVDIVYWDGSSWSTDPATVKGQASAQQTPVSAPTYTPSPPSSPPAASVAPSTFARPTARSKEIDEVWKKIQGKLALEGEPARKVWHPGAEWIDFDELYAPPEEEVVKPAIPMPAGPCFPLGRSSFVRSLNNFGDDRKDKAGKERCHVGLDLLTKSPGKVVAVEDGVVVNIHSFLKNCKDGWSLSSGQTGDTVAVLVYNSQTGRTINYGEVDVDKVKVSQGQQVRKGDQIGIASYCGMLHFELYEGKVDHNIQWWPPSGESTIGNNKCTTQYLHTKDEKIQNPTFFVDSLNFCDVQGLVIPPPYTTTRSTTGGGYDIITDGQALVSTQNEWTSALQRNSLTGKTWIGKLASNGAGDDFYRENRGRETIIFVPHTTNINQPLEIMYYFHGLSGFGLIDSYGSTDFDKRLAPQAKEMAAAGRNFVLVVPEMPWSRGEDYSKRKGNNDRQTSLLRRNNDQGVNFAVLHRNVIHLLSTEFGMTATTNVNYISMTGHSAGGASIWWAAESGALNSIGVNKITLSDADYYGATQKIWDKYAKTNNVELNLLVQTPTVFSSSVPAQKTVAFLKKEFSVTSDLGNQKFLGGKVNYVPLHKAHKKIGEMSLAWTSGSSPSSSSSSGTSASATAITDASCAGIKQSPQEQFKRKNYRSTGTLDAFTEFRVRNYGFIPGEKNENWNTVKAGDNLVRDTFMGDSIRVNQKILSPLKCVEKELTTNGKCNSCSPSSKYPNECNLGKSYPYRPSSTSTYRSSASFRGAEISNHRFGIAIDFDPQKNTCCGCVGEWRDHPLCQDSSLQPYERMIIPTCWIDVFEEYGFYWLGDDTMRDTMHFEFLGNPNVIS